jgi:hypothetical protein
MMETLSRVRVRDMTDREREEQRMRELSWRRIKERRINWIEN